MQSNKMFLCLNNVQTICRSCQDEVKHCEDLIKSMGPEEDMSKVVRRRMEAVSRQKQNKVS